MATETTIKVGDKVSWCDGRYWGTVANIETDSQTNEDWAEIKTATFRQTKVGFFVSELKKIK